MGQIYQLPPLPQYVNWNSSAADAAVNKFNTDTATFGLNNWAPLVTDSVNLAGAQFFADSADFRAQYEQFYKDCNTWLANNDPSTPMYQTIAADAKNIYDALNGVAPLVQQGSGLNPITNAANPVVPPAIQSYLSAPGIKNGPASNFDIISTQGSPGGWVAVNKVNASTYAFDRNGAPLGPLQPKNSYVLQDGTRIDVSKGQTEITSGNQIGIFGLSNNNQHTSVLRNLTATDVKYNEQHLGAARVNAVFTDAQGPHFATYTPDGQRWLANNVDVTTNPAFAAGTPEMNAAFADTPSGSAYSWNNLLDMTASSPSGDSVVNKLFGWIPKLF